MFSQVKTNFSKNEETCPLLKAKQDNDILIEIDCAPNPSLADIPQDIFDHEISQYISYKHGLAALSQTSKEMYQIVMKTPSGRVASELNQFNPSKVQQLLATSVAPAIGCCLMSSGILMMLFSGAYFMIQEDFSQAIRLLTPSGSLIFSGSLCTYGLFKNQNYINVLNDKARIARESLRNPLVEAERGKVKTATL